MRDLHYYKDCTIINNPNPAEQMNEEKEHSAQKESSVPNPEILKLTVEPGLRERIPLELQSDEGLKYLMIAVLRGWLDTDLNPNLKVVTWGFAAVLAEEVSHRLGIAQPYASFGKLWNYKYLSQASGKLTDSDYDNFKVIIGDTFNEEEKSINKDKMYVSAMNKR